jgi:hypothetical protein
MDEQLKEKLAYAEELAVDAAAADIKIAEDISQFVMWITVLSTGGIGLVITQSTKLISSNPTARVYLICAVVFLTVAVLLGVFSRYQVQKSIENYRIMILRKKSQKLAFYDNLHSLSLSNISLSDFGKRYEKCEFLGTEFQSKYAKNQLKNERWYSEEYARWVQLFFFILGYLALVIPALI